MATSEGFRRWRRRLVTGVAGLVLAACSSAGGAEDAAVEPPADVPHGYVEGAEEVAEAQVSLALAERGASRLAIVDLATERTSFVELAVEAAELVEDGRFVYVLDERGGVEVVDAGVWTVDHGDHVHFYRAPAASLGVVELDAPAASVVGAGRRTAIGSADGTVTVLDRAALEDGVIEVVATLRSDADRPFAVPHATDLLLASATRVTSVDDAGAPTGDVDAPCTEPAGWAALRGGVVIGCSEGALIVKRGAARLVPYPSAAGRITALEHRPRANEASALAGTDGVWSVHVVDETLTFVPVGAPVATSSPADGAHVLSLDAAGVVHLTRIADGARVAEVQLLPPGASSPIRLDRSRAYVADADGRRVLELDHGDHLRLARTLELDVRPDLVVEVGR